MRFLVIDQSATMRRILVNSLNRIGFADVVEAADAAQGLAAFDRTCGFVITDGKAPNVSDESFLRAMRSRPGGNDVPILMVTTRKARPVVESALRAGVSGAIMKPFTPRLLQEKIEQLLAARKHS